MLKYTHFLEFLALINLENCYIFRIPPKPCIIDFWPSAFLNFKTVFEHTGIIAPKAPLFQRPKVSNGSCLFACPLVTDFGDFYGYRLRRPHPLFPLLSFQLGFSGIPGNDEKTSISPSNERYTWTPFWDPFLSFFSEKVLFSLEG